jgi:hypothetical protein
MGPKTPRNCEHRFRKRSKCCPLALPPIAEEPARIAAIYVPGQVTGTNPKNDYFSRILRSLRKSIFMGRFIFLPGKEIWHNHLRSHFHNQSPPGCHL